MHEGEVSWSRSMVSLSTPADTEQVPFRCGTCGNTNPYVIGKVIALGNSWQAQDCLECLESEEYMNTLIEEGTYR